MFFTTASNSSPLIYYFTLALLIITPLILWIIGIVSVRKDTPEHKRVGYAFLKIAGFITALVLCGFVYMWSIGALSGPGFDDPNVQTTTVAEQTNVAETTAAEETTAETTAAETTAAQ